MDEKGHNSVLNIHHPLRTDVFIFEAPCRKDTFAAIALVTAYHHGYGENSTATRETPKPEKRLLFQIR